MIRQRKDGDCGIASLAMLLEQSYEDVYVAAATVDKKHRGAKGTGIKELQAIAGKLGHTLRHRRRFNLDEDDGVLGVMWLPKLTKGHWVTLKRGLVFDPAMELPITATDWLLQNKAKATCLLTEE
jgi:ABC-type bacteriocin/lantibiotic exporter with double-glycine peptidase domain